MQKYFCQIDNGKIVLNDGDIHHLLHVMRKKVNDQIIGVFNETMYLGKIKSLNPLDIDVIDIFKPDVELKKDVCLILCLPKGDKIDFIIQKSVELGAKKLILVKSKRSINKMDNQDFNRKLERYNKIIKEASEQCGRTSLMKIEGIYTFIDLAKLKGLKIVANENKAGQTGSLSSLINDCTSDSIYLLIGPEGGLEATEIDELHEYGFKDVSLGKRILRLETASIYALSIISYLLEQKND